MDCEQPARWAAYGGHGRDHTYYRLCDEHAEPWPLKYRLAKPL